MLGFVLDKRIVRDGVVIGSSSDMNPFISVVANRIAANQITLGRAGEIYSVFPLKDLIILDSIHTPSHYPNVAPESRKPTIFGFRPSGFVQQETVLRIGQVTSGDGIASTVQFRAGNQPQPGSWTNPEVIRENGRSSDGISTLTGNRTSTVCRCSFRHEAQVHEEYRHNQSDH
jgi:hypothetical protein